MLYCKGLTRFLPSFHFLHISVGFPPVFLLSLSRSAVITVFLFCYFFLFFFFYVEYRSNQNLVSCRAKDDSKLIFFPLPCFPSLPPTLLATLPLTPLSLFFLFVLSCQETSSHFLLSSSSNLSLLSSTFTHTFLPISPSVLVSL